MLAEDYHLSLHKEIFRFDVQLNFDSFVEDPAEMVELKSQTRNVTSTLLKRSKRKRDINLVNPN